MTLALIRVSLVNYEIIDSVNLEFDVKKGGKHVN